ncbi:MAG: hypothetical protein WCE75_05485 [Terracidiphilus sp.]
MRFPLSTPGELAEEPELAPLEILRSAAEVSRRAILAAQPDLASRESLDEVPDVTPRQYIAASILGTLDLLAEAVDHYVAHLDDLAGRRHARRTDDDIPF